MNKGYFRHIITISSILLAFCACSDDNDFVYPNMITELAEMKTGKDGNIQSLVVDNGICYEIQNKDKYDGLIKDSTYRVLASYVQVDDENKSLVEIKTIRLTYSSYPIKREKVKQIATDPVELQSIWTSGNYLNVYVISKVKDIQHIYRFIEDSITTSNGRKTLHLSLLHQRNNDIEGYNRTVYLSVPLYPYHQTFSRNDSVSFTLNTYKNGFVKRTFPFPIRETLDY